MPAAPVQFCKKNIVNGYASGLVVNAGVANSFTGKKGIKDIGFERFENTKR